MADILNAQSAPKKYQLDRILPVENTAFRLYFENLLKQNLQNRECLLNVGKK
jgi:hypothetical protein